LENVKKHFEEEAEEFDKTIQQLIPLYSEMIDSMITAIPHNVSDKFIVLDLGCGTGNVSKAVKERFPMAMIDCIDIAENMIEMAKIKLEGYNDIKYYTGDFSEFDFETKYDVVVSSLALHHIKTDEEKKKFYMRIYYVLSKGGVFLNSDNVLGSNQSLNEIYMEKWIEFMLQNVSKKEVEEKWLPKHVEEDFPAPLIQHLQWLNEIGFKNIDIIWKYYGSAVYCGTRP
jgi:tRNA (cmo5U34)-methyltransferase